MNIDLTDEQAELAATTRRFLATTMPITEVRALAETPSGFDREWWRRCAELGWTYMLAAGDGAATTAGLADLVIVAEEVGRSVAPGPLLPTNVVAWAVANAGRPAARAAYLDGLTSGEVVGAWAMAEQTGSWDPGAVELRAEGTADGVVLNGVKSYVEAGADADLLLVTARSAAGELVQALVLPSDAGVSLTRLEGIDLVRRFAALELVDVRVPADRLVDAAGSVADDVDRQLQIAVALQCAEMAGAIDRVFEFTVEWVVRPLLVRPAAGLVPGAQAPLRRHEDVARGLPRGGHRRGAGRVRPARPTRPRPSAWPRRTSASTAPRSSRTACRCTAASG